ncbi:MAG: lipopolysaccharide heptosyltransferase II [Phycisphaerae bacterium]|jgi:heptosyltransferase-2
MVIPRPSRYNPAMPQWDRVVIFLPNWIGDVVMATPALRALRRHLAGSHICHVGKPAALETLDGLALADETVADLSASGGKLSGLAAMVRALRAGRYDLAILLPNSFRSALTAFLGGAARRAGYARDGRGFLLTDTMPPPRDARGRYVPISAVDYYLDLTTHLGARRAGRTLALAVPPSAAQAAATLLADSAFDPSRPLVMLNPGAAFGVSKMWKPARFAALADALVERRAAQIIINAAPSERAIAEAVECGMHSRPLINFARRDNSISLLKALAARCQLVVTNDTGARHIAAGLGTPVVTIFGSTDPRWAAIDFDRERIIRVAVPCSPCQQRLCFQRPGPAYHQCMEAITCDMVLPACEELLSAGRSEQVKAALP